MSQTVARIELFRPEAQARGVALGNELLAEQKAKQGGTPEQALADMLTMAGMLAVAVGCDGSYASVHSISSAFEAAIEMSLAIIREAEAEDEAKATAATDDLFARLMANPKGNA